MRRSQANSTNRSLAAFGKLQHIPFTSSLTSRLVVTGLLCWALAGTAYAVLRLTFGDRPVRIHVRWAPTINDAARLQLEQRYQLARPEPIGDRAFGYALTDHSQDNIRNLVLDSTVEDTHEIDRAEFRVGSSAPRLPYVTGAPYVPAALEALIALLGVASAFAFGVALAQWMGVLDRLLAWLTRIGRRLLAWKQWLILLFVVTVVGSCFFTARTMELKADEQSHYAQFERYVAGNYVTTTSAAGGFEATAAIFARLTGGSTKEDIRLFALLISGATMLLFRSLLRSFEPQASTMRTLQFVFFPLLFPFWFLIYTDVYALMWLLLALLALTRDRVHLTGILMIVSLLVRQTYIVWLAMLGLWTVIVNSAAPLRQIVTRGTGFVIGAGLFLLFVLVNGGIAVGDQRSHPDFVFHTENLLFMLSCFFVMFLPLILSTLSQIVRLPPALLVGVPLSSVVLYFGTFQVDHSNNIGLDYYLHNALLEAMTASTGAGVVTSVAIALTVLSLCVIRLRQPVHYLLYPFAALSVMPSWLIEQRYYLPAFALFMLFRESASPRVERTLLAVNVIMALCLFVGVAEGWFFL